MALSSDFLEELRRHFAGDIRLDLGSRILYSTDASIYQIEPLGVVLPRTQDDLQAAVELAVKYRVPILPRGSGSSLAGQAIGEALIVDCSRWLDKIVEIDQEARTATVEPGVILANLNRAAAKMGLQFGPDPASAERATMGGVIANNATGAHSILYGTAADHLISAEVVLGDGSLDQWGSVEWSALADRPSALGSAVMTIRNEYADAIKRDYPSTWRNSAGYRLNYLLPWSPTAPPQWIGNKYPPIRESTVNLAALLAGSEGTLAVIRRAVINLVSKPRHTILGILSYKSIPEACDAVPTLLRRNPSAIELIPQLIIRLARSVPAYASQMEWVAGDPSALLVVEFSGDQPKALKEAVLQLRGDVVIAETAEEQARVWNVRKVGLGILDSRSQSARPAAFIEDCVVPVERLAEFIREVEMILKDHKTEGGIYAHASAGCLHIRPILDLRTTGGVRALRSIAEQVLALTLRLGGSMASEHGDGIARGEWLRQTYSDEICRAMQILKKAVDPYELLNPRKMLDAPPMDTHLRFGVAYKARPWVPKLDFVRNNGLAGAIEQCNGQGVCRKETDVMCPSFQATRQEQNSTRGRANLLRALISSPTVVDHRQEVEAAVHAALDLCLACKGCKAECPSGVDMAKLKFEFENKYYQSHRRPLRDYLFGYFSELARFGSHFGWTVNFLFKNRFVRQLLNKFLGIAFDRELPRFGKRTKIKPRTIDERSNSSVILMRDTFTHFFEPEIEKAALDLLDVCGLNVVILPTIGAGRTLISKGFLDAAKRHANVVLDQLKQIDPGGLLPILGLEPSEINTIRDEFFDLLPDRADETTSLASRTWSAEEYLIRPERGGEKPILRIATKPNNTSPLQLQKVLLHSHCSQKAQSPSPDGRAVGQQASAEFLRAMGFDVEIIPSGCCGMAGAFGYEAEHYDVSMKVGELILFGALKSSSNSLIAATGTSCRTQIKDGTGKAAQHPLVIAARLL